jgi:hypothetical protein
VGAEIGQSVAAWVVDQRSTLILNIAKRDPYPAHKPQRIAMKMNGVAVIGLLTANGKVERLKGKRLTAIHLPQ